MTDSTHSGTTEDARTMKRLLICGNTQAVVAAAVLRGIAADHDVSREEILNTANDLLNWSRDVRAVASEQVP